MTFREGYYPINFTIGAGETDYEKYLRTVELLGLQKPADKQVSPQELLFQVTHQTSELWMKEMLHNLEGVIRHLDKDEIAMASRSLSLVCDIQKLLIRQVDMLGEHLSIVEYGKIRTALGQGSGMESPGFNWLLAIPPRVWEAFSNLLSRRKITVRDIYVNYAQQMELHTLAEHLMTFDDLFHKWRSHHLDLVTRTIGLESNSLKGLPTRVLQRGAIERFFPELLALRNTLTNESALAYGASTHVEESR